MYARQELISRYIQWCDEKDDCPQGSRDTEEQSSIFYIIVRPATSPPPKKRAKQPLGVSMPNLFDGLAGNSTENVNSISSDHT